MGGGSYDSSSRNLRAVSSGYYTKSSEEIFSGGMHDSMSPKKAHLRESRDSEEHPNSLPIILSLDVTGSMGSIPMDLIKDGLPTIMQGIIDAGIPDPQLLFLAVGDHIWDRHPLQVGQFESSDELLDNWLTKVFIESGGGGNGGESYGLAHYFAAYHTSIDSLEKRGNKGFLFTIGDEKYLPTYSKNTIQDLMGLSESRDFTFEQLYEVAKEKYHVYHLHLKQGMNGRDENVMNSWKRTLGENLIIVDSIKDIPKFIAQIVSQKASSYQKEVFKPNVASVPSSGEQVMML
jgi:hypothetical protein